jgi:hypothetical protein
MPNTDMEIVNLVQHHQAIQAHLKFLIHSVGRLDPQSCRIASSSALHNRIALYRWSLYDFKEAIQRHNELDKRIFQGSRAIERVTKENQAILEQITGTIALADSAVNNKVMREELNVFLVKITMALNKICETIDLHMAKEEALVKQHQKSRVPSTR